MDYVARTPEQLGQDSKRLPQKARPDSAGGDPENRNQASCGGYKLSRKRSAERFPNPHHRHHFGRLKNSAAKLAA